MIYCPKFQLLCECKFIGLFKKKGTLIQHHVRLAREDGSLEASLSDVRLHTAFVLSFGAVGALLGYIIFRPDESFRNVFLIAITFAAAGALIPKYWKARLAQSYSQKLAAGFPDALDMLLVCLEAGQSIDNAILSVARELESIHADLAKELMLASLEVSAGKGRENALRDMARRCGNPDINSFISTLLQSLQYGTSISDTIRVLAAEMRDKRFMRAEEKANTLPVKMTLASMFLTVPPLLLILVGPAIYDIYLMLAHEVP